MESQWSLQGLGRLSRVSKITAELGNRLSTDKTLVEFIINLHQPASSHKVFNKIIPLLGVDFPDALITMIGRLVLTIHLKHKNKQSRESGDKSEEGTKKEIKPDTKPIEEGKERKRKKESNTIADMMAVLENLESKSKSENKKGGGGGALSFLGRMELGSERSRKLSYFLCPYSRSWQNYRSRSGLRSRGEGIGRDTANGMVPAGTGNAEEKT
ncbi:hypothetical protein HOY80DRAFT_1088285 [Tuber brumale]|nr:hypothetical protein HOY80DRAFT_1088285 [Tuber brumale]